MENHQESQCSVERELGRGSFGSVYLLTYSHSPDRTNSKYALKVIEETGARAHDRETAHKELRIMRGLYHPNVVGLIDSFEVHHRLLLVLQLCEGGDLRGYLDKVKASRRSSSEYLIGVEESLAVKWAQQLAAGLHYLHRKKILHRDLKPQNIFLRDKFNLKIGDLGIARQLVFTKEMAATHIGTPLYISPEIYQGNAYSYKTDVWSLGCCVYEMMALRYAFHATSRYELVGNVINKEVLPLPVVYSQELRLLVLCMLCKDPNGRPSAGDLVTSLQDIDTAQPQPQWERKEGSAGEDTQTVRPSDASSLRVWRLDMARALTQFLNKKYAAQSAELNAAMAKNMSAGSIKDIDESSGKDVVYSQSGSSGKREQRWQRRRISGKATSAGTGDSEGESESHAWSSSQGGDATSTLSSNMSQASYISDLSSSACSQGVDELSLSSSVLTQGTDQYTLVFEEDSGSSSESHSATEDTALASQKVTLRNRQRNRDQPAKFEKSDSDDDNDLNSSNTLTESYSYVSGRSIETDSQPKPVKIGKSSMVVRSRPLPQPRVHKENNGNAGKTDFSQTISDTLASDSITTLTLNDSTPDGKMNASVSQAHSPKRDTQSGQPLNGKDLNMAYASEVLQWARARLLPSISQDLSASSSQQDKVPVSNEKTGERRYVPEDCDKFRDLDAEHKSYMAAGAGDDVMNGVHQEKGRKKKRNFLKERKAKHLGEDMKEEKPAEKTPAKDEQEQSVKLFTRAQRVSFCNQNKDEVDLSIGSSREEVMIRDVGQTRLQAAISTAVLLTNNPSLLQLQLREMLGRENYKKYAAEIVARAKSCKPSERFTLSS